MAYESQFEVIKENVLAQATNKLKNTLDEYLGDEIRRASGDQSKDELLYYAELRYWRRTFGHRIPFPGKRPAPQPRLTSLLSSTTSASPSLTLASQNRSTLESLFLSIPKFHAYTPQFGWNPHTGEPWLTLASQAPRAFQKLSHDRQQKQTLEDILPGRLFKIHFLHLAKYVLVWPEFRIEKWRDVDEEAWKEMALLRGFLGHWTRLGQPGDLVKDYGVYMKIPENMRVAVPLPEGFPIDEFQSECNDKRERQEREKRGHKQEVPAAPGPKEQTTGRTSGFQSYTPAVPRNPRSRKSEKHEQTRDQSLPDRCENFGGNYYGSASPPRQRAISHKYERIRTPTRETHPEAYRDLPTFGGAPIADPSPSPPHKQGGRMKGSRSWTMRDNADTVSENQRVQINGYRERSRDHWTWKATGVTDTSDAAGTDTLRRDGQEDEMEGYEAASEGGESPLGKSLTNTSRESAAAAGGREMILVFRPAVKRGREEDEDDDDGSRKRLRGDGG